MEYIVKILSTFHVTHNVKVFRISKPAGYRFEPGQATEVSINKPALKEEKRPFTFTCLNEEAYLEFTIKIYDDHAGVTHELGKLVAGDELIIRDVWGAISYKGAGYFIAGGAGITPFIAILRQLKKAGKLAGNRLYFSNKTVQDIILRDEFEEMLGPDVHFIVTEKKQGSNDGEYIDKDFLLREIHDFKKPFYVCGPDNMVMELTQTLLDLGTEPDTVIFEK